MKDQILNGRGLTLARNSLSTAACLLVSMQAFAELPSFSSKAELGVRVNAGAANTQATKPSKQPKCLDKGSVVVFPSSKATSGAQCVVKCDGKMVAAQTKPAGRSISCVVSVDPSGARACSVELRNSSKQVVGATRLPGCKADNRSMTLKPMPADKPPTGLRAQIGQRSGPLFDRSRLGPPVNGQGGGGSECRNPAVVNLMIRPHGGPDGNEGFIVSGDIQNIGNAHYHSGANQQAMYLYYGTQLLQQRPFGDLVPNSPRVSIGYVVNTYNPSTDNKDLKLRISYDPDILSDGNPENDDCNNSDNLRTLPASEIRRIMASVGNG